MPTTFLDLMERYLCSYLSKFIFFFLFIYEISVYSRNKKEHKDELRIILELLKKEKLFGKFNKRGFGFRKVSFLGHIVSQDGIFVDLEKIKVITDWLILSNVTKIRIFLGLTGKYVDKLFRFLVPSLSC